MPGLAEYLQTAADAPAVRPAVAPCIFTTRLAVGVLCNCSVRLFGTIIWALGLPAVASST
jgi:hypothetical protein